MITGEIIQRIQSLYSKGVQSDDSRLSSRHIYNKMLTIRAKLLEQKVNKKQPLSQWNYQTISCAELIPTKPYEAPCLPLVGCEILKTKHKLPKLINTLFGHKIQSVTSLDGSVIYSEVSWVEKKYKSSNKYTGNKPDFFIKEDYLYITQKPGPRVITIVGLFENPLSVDTFSSYCNECKDCNECESPLDKEFPLDNTQIDTLVEMCVNELVVLFNQNIEDKSNNSADSIDQQSK